MPVRPLSDLQQGLIGAILRGQGNNSAIEESQKEFVANAHSPSLELMKEYLGQFLDVKA